MRRPVRLALLAALLLAAALAADARPLLDRPLPENGQENEVCEPQPPTIAPPPYLNGLPIVGHAVEIVGEQTQVVVETWPACDVETVSGLPYQWRLTGPAGPIALPHTLRPSFTPSATGTYEALLTICPSRCPVQAGTREIRVGPLTARLRFEVVDHLVVPPSTIPLPTPEAQDPTQRMPQSKDWRQVRCGIPGPAYSQLVPVTDWVDAGSYEHLDGKVQQSNIAGHDYEFNHDSHDVGIHVVPDPRDKRLLVEGAGSMEVEWESNTMPPDKRPLANDRISAFGFHTLDCHHDDDELGILTEIHPPVLTAVHRVRPIEIPDGWAPPGGTPIGSDIFVPGIVTDVWANRDAGEMTRDCTPSGLHQARPSWSVPQGACIQAPHPIRRRYEFNIYLPQSPQQRLAAAGISAQPVPLYVAVEPPDENLTVVPDFDDGHVPHTPQTNDDVWFLRVTFDLPAFVEVYGSYARRIKAAWVLPSVDNWGLERWKAGITSIDVLNDHEGDSPYGGVSKGNWVFWVGLNNRDREWIQLFDLDEVGPGTYDFGSCPWQTEQGDTRGPRSLGPHLLLFDPRPDRHFDGPPEQDPTQSALLAASGYEDESPWSDDPTGSVLDLRHLAASGVPVGGRLDLTAMGTLGDYRLHYFFERLGPVAPARLERAGLDLVAAYTFGPSGVLCPNQCVLLPAQAMVDTWHPLLTRTTPGPPRATAWRDHPIFEPQEDEPVTLTNAPADEMLRAMVEMRERTPERVDRFAAALRRRIDAARATPRARARDLGLYEARLPAEVWQLHFGDIDPTPVDLAVRTVAVSPADAGAPVVVTAEVANLGTGAAAPFTVELAVDGVSAGTVSVSALAPGATTRVTFPPWRETAGAHTARVAADSAERIAEPIERNNARDRTFVTR